MVVAAPAGSSAADALAALGSGEVHVWISSLDETDSQALARCRALLCGAERERLGRLVSDALKHEFLLTRGLCRVVLSTYVDVRPEDWRFEPNAFGKPAIARGPGIPHLRFNLSNARTVVACAVALDVDVGVDVEMLNRPDDALPMSPDIFSSSELLVLRNASTSNRARRFYELWTLKEAYAKARGTGLFERLDRVSFHPCGGSTSVRFGPGSDDHEDDWQFEQINADRDHLLALAIRKRAAPRLRCSFRRTRIGAELPNLSNRPCIR